MKRRQTVKTALLLIDLQNDYFPGGKMELVGSEAAAANARRLLDRFREREQPIIHLQHLALRPQAGFFLPDTHGVEIHPLVAPLAGEPLVQKHFPNSFRDTHLLELLRKNELERLLICGAMSHMCIDASTRAAFDLGFTCILAHDACATRDLEFGGMRVPAAQVHAAFMAALGAVSAQMLPTAEILGTEIPG
jgi:nicotinamidase-related amidase